ncbi:class I SAM-dependent methyltransferase [Sphingomonas sp. CARO-RG-8B-R24-01]|uniref:class I SAM-dependent methyltransferase n=1 Tax=Sphingomonas sp. CARO-RG-8B-R24-01 TaxID=2914831 RepID=UPI001F57BAA5|nr:class I SAM-dependent methyltransferase [Sphingomonas sp. CARO-RG-8B-R24-01]
MKPIDLAGFERKFADHADPWSTFTDRDEAHKRGAILHGLGPGPIGRVLELAAGNGSNSVALARRALRLDATEGTQSGVDLVDRALRAAVPGRRHVRVRRLVLPGGFPGGQYDAVVIAEVLYYLSPRDMARVARDVVARLRPGGRLVLAHHRVDYPDFVQYAARIHGRFLAASGAAWRTAGDGRTGRWRVQSYVRR